jgi:hypothetical protein
MAVIEDNFYLWKIALENVNFLKYGNIRLLIRTTSCNIAVLNIIGCMM